MSGTKTIDVRRLGHAEKEGLIFPSIEKLTDLKIRGGKDNEYSA